MMKKFLSFSKILCLILSVALILPLLAACDITVTFGGDTTDSEESTVTTATDTESRDVNKDEDDETATDADDLTDTDTSTDASVSTQAATSEPIDGSQNPESTYYPIVTAPATSEPIQVTDPADTMHDLPADLNFGGREITFLAEFEDMQEDEFYLADGYTPTGEMLPDAVYERNRAVEKQLNVDIVVKTRKGEYLNSVHQIDHQSGMAQYQVIADRTTNKGVMILDNYYYNLNNFEHLDLTKDYWSQGFGEVVTFTKDAKQYLVTGPIAVSLYRSMYATIYNSEALAHKGIDDLYQTIVNGQWTLAVQKAMIENTWADGDGDGKKSEGDYFGLLAGQCVSMDPYFVSSGVELVKKNSETYDWYFDNDEISYADSVAKAVQEITLNDSTYCFEKAKDLPTSNDIIVKFANNEGLMATILLYSLERCYGEIDFNYGIAPIPKYSTDQTEYRTYVHDAVTCVGVNSAVKDEDDLEAIGAVLEAMAFHSNIFVKEAYFEKSMGVRYQTDPRSQKILNMMHDSVAFDFLGTMSSVIDIFRLRDELRPILSSGGSAETLLTKNKTLITRALSRTINNKANALP